MANEVKQIIPMSELDTANKLIEGQAQLELGTDKYNDKIVSSAFVWYRTKDSTCSFSTQDFRKRYAQNKGMATQKALQRQHDATFTPQAIEAIKAEVLAFYKKTAQVA